MTQPTVSKHINWHTGYTWYSFLWSM